MPLLAHLSEADIGRYVAGSASTETERHVRICVSCMQRLGDAAQRAVRWERLSWVQNGYKIRVSSDNRTQVGSSTLALAGLEPATSWVRKGQMTVCPRRLGLPSHPRSCPFRPVLSVR
jgi:hypothetical protein